MIQQQSNLGRPNAANFDINNRFVLACQLTGGGCEETQVFSKLLEIDNVLEQKIQKIKERIKPIMKNVNEMVLEENLKYKKG